MSTPMLLSPRTVVPDALDEEAVLRDPQRLAAIPGLREELRAPMDAVAALALHALAGSASWVSLLGADEQHAIGSATSTPQRASWPVRDGLCLHTVTLGDPLMLGELRRDRVAAANPAARAGFRAYAGAPLRLAGERVGTLCVLDVRARAWTLGDTERLVALAGVAEHLLATLD